MRVIVNRANRARARGAGVMSNGAGTWTMAPIIGDVSRGEGLGLCAREDARVAREKERRERFERKD